MNFVGSETDLGGVTAAGERPESGVEKFISFELGGNLWCVPANCVAEVVHPIAVAALPNSPEWLLGLGAHRGEPVAVIDPAVVAASSAADRSKAKLLIFRSRPNETQFALPIDLLHEMILLPAGEQRSGEILHNGRRVTFIEHELLFESFSPGRISSN